MTEPGARDSAPVARRRVFFALWPDADTRRAIARATGTAVRRSRGKPTPLENLHVTLAFLGPVTAEALASLLAVVPPSTMPFELRLDRLGHWRRSQILWFGPESIPNGLLALEARLWEQLVPRGFERDPRPFRPHVTLARKARVQASAQAQAVVWPVRSVALLESRPGPRHARYEVLASWMFTPGAEP